MTTYSQTEVLAKTCEIKLNDSLYYCYNVTSLFHFVKLGKDGQTLSTKNKNNLLSMTREQLERFINLGSITVTVGVKPN